MPEDNHHIILHGILTGQLNNIPEEVHQQHTIPAIHRTSISDTSTSTHVSSNYLTRGEMEQMLNAHRQQMISDMSTLCDNMRTTIVSDISHLHNNLETTMAQQSDRQQRQYETIFQRQDELFQRHEKLQQDYNEIIQSRMHPQHDPLHQDASIHTSPVVQHTSTFEPTEDTTQQRIQQIQKGKSIQSSIPLMNYPLEDYSTDRYLALTNWIAANPPR
jgi:ElaB/YqjD/DUF883 family membrane-anchored ribosome-binding protein